MSLYITILRVYIGSLEGYNLGHGYEPHVEDLRAVYASFCVLYV